MEKLKKNKSYFLLVSTVESSLGRFKLSSFEVMGVSKEEGVGCRGVTINNIYLFN